MRHLNIAIFNSFPYHYEMFGFIYNWVKYNGHNLVIYSETENDLGFTNWYNKYFGHFVYKEYTKILADSPKYDIIFVTTDNDDEIDIIKKIVDKESNFRIVVINHISRTRCLLTNKHLYLKPCGQNLWNLPVYDIKYINLKLDPNKIHILFNYGRHIDLKAFEYLAKQNNVIIYVVSREPPDYIGENIVNCSNIETDHMINLIGSVDYVFQGFTDTNSEDYMSGALPLALSCNTPTIMDQGTFDSYDNMISDNVYKKHIRELKLIKKDHSLPNNKLQHYVGMFDQNLQQLFPNYYTTPIIKNLKIPKIIHFMWFSTDNSDIPSKYHQYLENFKIHNPEYEFKIWLRNNTLDEVYANFPQYYEDLLKIQPIISVCDILRFMVVYIYGGLYIDADFNCRRNVSPLLDNKDILIFEEMPEHQGNYLCNGCFAASPKHDFILGWIAQMFENRKQKVGVMETTGPSAFYKYFSETENKPELSDGCLIMPYTQQQSLSCQCSNTDDHILYTLWSEGSGWGSSEQNTTTNTTTINTIIILSVIVIISTVIISLYLSNKL